MSPDEPQQLDEGTTPDTAKSESLHLPRETTPTWESELLISGAVVFSMLQLPGVLDGWSDRLGPKLGGAWHTAVQFLFLYARIVVFALITTFVSHLLTRGFWTALVGLRSVYPDGVRWDLLNNKGPNYLSEARRRTRPLAEMIERVDNFASVIFAYGALLVMMSITALAMTLLVFGLTGLLASALSLDRATTDTLLESLLVLAIGPLVLAGFLDKRIARRMAPEHWLSRVLRRVFALYRFVPMTRFSEPMMLVFVSNVGRRRGMFLVIGGLYVMIALAIFESLVHRGAVAVDGYAYLPSDGNERVIEPRHYANQRAESRSFSNVPYIQADIVTEPYLKLFVPYSPDRHTAAIRKQCPTVSAVAGADPATESNRRAAVLGCVADLLQIQLDGKALPNLQLDFATDPTSDLRGFVAYLPLHETAAGRHELSVQRLPHLLSREGEVEPPDRIAFWR